MKKIDFISVASAVLFVLSIFYLGAETIFNMALLDIAGSVKSSTVDIERIQYFGRSVSAFGCYLLVLGFFVTARFSLAGKRQKIIFLMVAFLSFVPLVPVLSTASRIGPTEMLCAFLPFVGVMLAFAVRRYQQVFFPAVILLIVWPAVFIGQKMLIEEAMVERTGWEERVNARYVLMLRAGFEDCTVSLDDLKLCDSEGRQDIVKSARIILGALWMLNPEGIRRDMIDNREKLIHAVATSDVGGSLADSYQKYLDGVAAERKKYQEEMIEKYHKPYIEASKLYAENTDMAVIESKVNKVADDIEREMEWGWRSYSEALNEYRRATGTAAINAAKKMAPWQQKLRDFCQGRKCPQFIQQDPAAMLSQAEAEAEKRFLMATGYPPSIDSYEVFVSHPRTQQMIRRAVDDHIHNKMGINNFSLPYNWRYDRAGLISLFKSLGAVQVNEKWREKFGTLPPGLSADDFFAALGYPPLPEMEDLAMDQRKFFDTVLLPEYKRKAVEMFDKIEGEKHLYANGAKEEARGRDYARAAYIPAISLVVSLIVVTMTILRWSAVGLSWLIRRSGVRAPRPVRYAIVTIFVGGLLALPYLAPNEYISGTGYQRYLQGAKKGSPVFATVLDWALHTQPLIYRFGTPLRKIIEE